MDWKRAVIALYACTDFVSGVQGYAAGAKMPWLVWNIAFAIGIGIGLTITFKRPKGGYIVCLLFAAADTLFYGRKLVLTKAIWPPAVVTAMAIASIVCIGIALLAARRPVPQPFSIASIGAM